MTASLESKDGEDDFDVDLLSVLPMLLGDTDTAPDGCDVESYLAMLDELDVSDSDKRVLIHTLWTLIETLLGIRFGVDPVSQALDAKSEKLALKSATLVDSFQTTIPLSSDQQSA